MECPGTPAICFPLVTKERFAELSGLEVGVVRGMLDRGHLPSCKVGRHRLVDLRELWGRAPFANTEAGCAAACPWNS
ncbi:MAG TPA: hypothetical protein VF267_00885 [Gammaproteobacteria bacterium]